MPRPLDTTYDVTVYVVDPENMENGIRVKVNNARQRFKVDNRFNIRVKLKIR